MTINTDASPQVRADEDAELVRQLREPKQWCCIFEHEGQMRHGQSDVPFKAAERIASRLSNEGRLREALSGLVAEFEKFSRYGSPIAMQANEAMDRAREALASSAEPDEPMIEAKLLKVREFLLSEYASAEAEANGYPVDRECRPAWDALHDALTAVHSKAMTQHKGAGE